MATALIIAGEKSGENYGAAVVRRIKEINPAITFFGIGGKNMEAAGVDILFPMESLAVVGIAEVIGQLPRIRKIFGKIRREVRSRMPAAALLIDSPDFNLRLAKRLWKLDVPVLYYISPTVWAWRAGRLKIIRRYVRKMLLIFPFEEAIYRKARISSRFVGHPLLERVRTAFGRENFCRRYGLDPEKKIIALLPGSRRSEIRYHLPVLVEAVKKLRRDRPVQFVLIRSEDLDPDFLQHFIPQDLKDLKVIGENAYEALAAADLALSACGTANLEAALLGTPLVAFYRLSPLTYFAGVKLVKIKLYSIVNILAGEDIIPELIQRDFTADNLVREAKRVLESQELRSAMKSRFAKIRAELGQEPASKNVADELARLIKV
jgi:lipid-A-disaccharide synthase